MCHTKVSTSGHGTAPCHILDRINTNTDLLYIKKLSALHYFIPIGCLFLIRAIPRVAIPVSTTDHTW